MYRSQYKLETSLLHGLVKGKGFIVDMKEGAARASGRLQSREGLRADWAWTGDNQEQSRKGRGAVEGEGELKTKRLGKDDDPERAKRTMGISELKGVREASGREAPELEEEPGCQNSLKCASGTCGAEEPGGQHVL